MSFELVSAEGQDEREWALQTVADWVTQFPADDLSYKLKKLYDMAKPVIKQIRKGNNYDEIKSKLEQSKFDLTSLQGWNDNVKKAFEYNDSEILRSDEVWDEMCRRTKKTSNNTFGFRRLTPEDHINRCVVTVNPSEKKTMLQTLLHRHYGPDLRDLILSNIRNEKTAASEKSSASCSCPPHEKLNPSVLNAWINILTPNTYTEPAREEAAEQIKKNLEILQVDNVQVVSKNILKQNYDTIIDDDTLIDAYIQSHPQEFKGILDLDKKRLLYRAMLQKALVY
jgi:hypothetical protein